MTETKCIRTFRCGSKQYVVIGTRNTIQGLFAATVKKALKPNGDAVCFEDGSKIWVTDDPIGRTNEEIVWNKDGQRILHERAKYTQSPSGNIHREVLRTVWGECF